VVKDDRVRNGVIIKERFYLEDIQDDEQEDPVEIIGLAA